MHTGLGFGLTPELLFRVFDRGLVRVGSGVMWLDRKTGVRWSVAAGRDLGIGRGPWVLYGGVDVDALRASDSSIRTVIPSIGLLTALPSQL